jgi:hypothetical protein
VLRLARSDATAEGCTVSWQSFDGTGIEHLDVGVDVTSPSPG